MVDIYSYLAEEKEHYYMYQFVFDVRFIWN